MSFFEKLSPKRRTLVLLLSKILAGTLLILFIGFILYALLFVVMFFI